MITIGQSGDAGQIHLRKHPPTGAPDNTAATYLVKCCGPFYEVRCETRAGGKLTGDQLVCTWRTEQEADRHATGLAKPNSARDRGHRILQELIEDSQ